MENFKVFNKFEQKQAFGDESKCWNLHGHNGVLKGAQVNKHINSIHLVPKPKIEKQFLKVHFLALKWHKNNWNGYFLNVMFQNPKSSQTLFEEYISETKKFKGHRQNPWQNFNANKQSILIFFWLVLGKWCSICGWCYYPLYILKASLFLKHIESVCNVASISSSLQHGRSLETQLWL